MVCFRFFVLFGWFLLPTPLFPLFFLGGGGGVEGGVGRMFSFFNLGCMQSPFYLSLFSPFRCLLPCLSFVVVCSFFHCLLFVFVVFSFLFSFLFLTFLGWLFVCFVFGFILVDFFLSFLSFFQRVFFRFFFFFFFDGVGGGDWSNFMFFHPQLHEVFRFFPFCFCSFVFVYF